VSVFWSAAEKIKMSNVSNANLCHMPHEAFLDSLDDLEAEWEAQIKAKILAEMKAQERQ
jgi:hypothetical protein